MEALASGPRVTDSCKLPCCAGRRNQIPPEGTSLQPCLSHSSGFFRVFTSEVVLQTFITFMVLKESNYFADVPLFGLERCFLRI